MILQVLGRSNLGKKCCPIPGSMLAAVVTGFTLAVAVETEIDPSLRGAKTRPRRVQWNGDSNQKVVPQCVTGDLVFIDIDR